MEVLKAKLGGLDARPSTLHLICQDEDLLNSSVEVIVHKQETKVKTYYFNKGPGHMSLLKAKQLQSRTIVVVVSNQLQPPLSIAASRNISELQKSVKVNTLPTFHRGSNISPAKKNKKRIVFVDDSLMRGTEVPIFHQDFSFQHIFYLPIAQIQIKMERMTKFIGPADHRPFLWLYLGKKNEGSWGLGDILH